MRPFPSRRVGNEHVGKVHDDKYFFEQKGGLAVALLKRGLRSQKAACRDRGPDVAPTGKWVISYSLLGNAHRHLDGAVTNAHLARATFPGWTVRLYVVSTTALLIMTECARANDQCGRAL